MEELNEKPEVESLTLSEMSYRAWQNAQLKGFTDGSTLKDFEEAMEQTDEQDLATRAKHEFERVVYEQLAKIHSKVAELTEAIHTGKYREKDSTKPGLELSFIEEELADIIIRTGHFAAFAGVDLDYAVQRKMAFNRTRPWKHGKKH